MYQNKDHLQVDLVKIDGFLLKNVVKTTCCWLIVAQMLT